MSTSGHEQQLQDEIHHLRRALEHRDVIGQAKGILMATSRISDDQAFAMLRTASQRRNTKLHDIAASIVADHNQLVGGGASPPRRFAPWEPSSTHRATDGNGQHPHDGDGNGNGNGNGHHPHDGDPDGHRLGASDTQTDHHTHDSTGPGSRGQAL